MKALAVKYRPKTFDDVTGQSEIKAILENQIATNTIKNGYLFCGGAGTGKTTCARIFASLINKGEGSIIELDAASNNSVDNIRDLCEQAQTKALDCEYKVFIIDECHSLSNQAWQAMLKTLEEPPAKSIFIFCTTNPEKIPATILSRVQRYNFQRLSTEEIEERLKFILNKEQNEENEFYNIDPEAIELIARVSEGGMRDAITLLDKCLSYSKELSVVNVTKCLNLVDYTSMFELLDILVNKDSARCISYLQEIYMSGADLKKFVKDYFEFLVGLSCYYVSGDFSYTKLPSSYANKCSGEQRVDTVLELLPVFLNLNNKIKWEQNPKYVITATLLLTM